MTGVLFVDHAEALGGAEHSLLLLLKHLDRRRFRPLLACNRGPLLQAAAALDVPVTPVEMPRIRGELLGPLWLLRGSLALAGLIRRQGADIVHSNVMRASFYAALSAHLTGRPLIWHVRDIHPPSERWYTRLMCRLATRVIAISQAVAAVLPCPDKVTVIYNGLDLEEYPPDLDGAAARAELGLPFEAPVAGIVGRLQAWKGQEHFLRAAARVVRHLPEARFLVVGGAIFGGGDAYVARLRRLAADLGGRVIFTGHRQDLPRLLAALDVLVHCSAAEPFGRVLIEGMAARRPVLAFADGAVPEIVRHGETGILVPPGDELALAAAMAELLGDAERRQRMGAAGRRRVEQHFTAAQTARAIEAMYCLVAKDTMLPH
ncbi:MAG: glycosyltransferase family 4 protein [Anaerolineae bacterium]|nr:glycosyltransferase family 4 protein [Anaerolineae bacterium]